mgnify:CR=1 FL=1
MSLTFSPWPFDPFTGVIYDIATQSPSGNSDGLKFVSIVAPLPAALLPPDGEIHKCELQIKYAGAKNIQNNYPYVGFQVPLFRFPNFDGDLADQIGAACSTDLAAVWRDRFVGDAFDPSGFPVLFAGLVEAWGASVHA